jgi:hypothetical protein
MRLRLVGLCLGLAALAGLAGSATYWVLAPSRELVREAAKPFDFIPQQSPVTAPGPVATAQDSSPAVPAEPILLPEATGSIASIPAQVAPPVAPVVPAAPVNPPAVAGNAVPPAYTFNARREAGALTLTGFYPDEGTRAAIHALARNLFIGDSIVDQMRPAEGLPKTYRAGVSFGLEQLSRLVAGEVRVDGTAIKIEGESLYEESAEQMTRTVSTIRLPGWTGEARIRTRSAELDARRSQP